MQNRQLHISGLLAILLTTTMVHTSVTSYFFSDCNCISYFSAKVTEFVTSYHFKTSKVTVTYMGHLLPLEKMEKNYLILLDS